MFEIVKAPKFTYLEILDTSSNLNDRIGQCFGPQGLGVCQVSDIPHYSELRLKLLPLAQKIATLPEDQLKQLERPDAFHIKGWSRGVEQFKGQFDTSKGSFYNNPNFDQEIPLSEEELKQLKDGIKIRIPNVWVPQIPEVESSFKNLGRLMIDVGAMLSYHIDKYIHSINPNYENGKLYRFVRQGDQHTGRLLHYFEGPNDQEWCGWHNDHSALTALTSAIYMKDDQIVDFQDKEGGLIAKNRFHNVSKISMDPDCLAFQIGETAQIVSGGIIEATPHCVVRGKECLERNLNRNTFAVFMAPKFNEKLNVPDGIEGKAALNKPGYNVPSLEGRWEENIQYLDYSARTLKSYAQGY